VAHGAVHADLRSRALPEEVLIALWAIRFLFYAVQRRPDRAGAPTLYERPDPV
jgi:hypothetical protein